MLQNIFTMFANYFLKGSLDSVPYTTMLANVFTVFAQNQIQHQRVFAIFMEIKAFFRFCSRYNYSIFYILYIYMFLVLQITKSIIVAKSICLDANPVGKAICKTSWLLIWRPGDCPG